MDTQQPRPVQPGRPGDDEADELYRPMDGSTSGTMDAAPGTDGGLDAPAGMDAEPPGDGGQGDALVRPADPAPGLDTPGKFTIPAVCPGCPTSNDTQFEIQAGAVTARD